jgi:hypothetical protein
MKRNIINVRTAITVSCLALAAILIYLGFIENPSTPSGSVLSGLWVNLGTGFLGIALTVAIVDWLFERREAKNEARRLAWHLLHKVDHAVWVWQGGVREFDPSELWALIRLIQKDDPLPPYTQNILIAIGSTADGLLKEKTDIIDVNTKLKDALNYLSKLCLIRDGDKEPMSPDRVAGYLRQGVWDLYLSLNLFVPEADKIGPILETVKLRRNASEELQRWRHDGEVGR